MPRFVAVIEASGRAPGAYEACKSAKRRNPHPQLRYTDTRCGGHAFWWPPGPMETGTSACARGLDILDADVRIHA